jgi:hypothetical protein
MQHLSTWTSHFPPICAVWYVTGDWCQRETCFCTVYSVVSVVMFAPSFAPFTPYIVTACDDKKAEQHIKECESRCGWLLISLGIGSSFGVHCQMLECISEICCTLLRFPLRRESGSGPTLCHMFAVFVYTHVYTVTFSNVVLYIHVLYQHRLCDADVTFISVPYDSKLKFLERLWAWPLTGVERLCCLRRSSPFPFSVLSIFIRVILYDLVNGT